MTSNYRIHRKAIRERARWCKHCKGTGERIEAGVSSFEVRLYITSCNCRDGVIS